MENGEAASWLDGRQAGRVLGLSADGVRKRAIRGLIQHRKGNDGRLRYLIPTNAVSEDIPQRLSETSFRHSADASLLIENARLADRLAAEERRSADLEASLREALAAEARRSADLLASLELERARADRLAGDLAEARKGWLERLLEAVRRR
jgi:hypothetical protein